jgi:integrase/recombinase XerD
MYRTDFINAYRDYLRLEKALSENSVQAYLNDVRKLAEYIEEEYDNLSLKDLQLSHLQSFLTVLNRLGLAINSQGRIVSGLRSFFTYLVLEGHIQENPAELLESPKTGRKLPDVLSISEIEMLFSHINMSKPEGTRNRAMLEILYSCGLRVSELINLEINNIFFEEEIILVRGKGNKERYVPVGKTALKYVQLYLQHYRNPQVVKDEASRSILFLNRRGKKLSRVMVFIIIKDLLAKSGISKNISPHSFRHSFATHLIEGGADLRSVQALLGHESILTTEIYTHLDQRLLRETIDLYLPRFKN